MTTSIGKGGRPPRLRRAFRRPPAFWLLDDYGSYYFHKLWNESFVAGFENHGESSRHHFASAQAIFDRRFTNKP